MAGISLLLEVLKKKSALSGPYTVVQSTNFASSAAVAASLAASAPFASRFFFSDVVHCDAAVSVPWGQEYLSNIRRASETVFSSDAVKYATKEYPVELRPLYSAFEPKAFTLTTVRSLLLFYLPLLEPHPPNDEDDFPEEPIRDEHVDLVTPLVKSVKNIVRETTVVTTRRVLERIVVRHVSPRMAWKLLKDLPKSARRKAEREIPTFQLFFAVTKSTLRGHFLGVAAQWFVQVGTDIYRYISAVLKEEDEFARSIKTKLFRKRIYSTSVKCTASLVFASIGAGIGSTVSPSKGQMIGCVIGDFAGPLIVAYYFDKAGIDL